MRSNPESDLDRADIDEVVGSCSALAREILSYMANRNADDTLEGIAEWWLLEHRIRTRTTLVRRAVDELVELGLVDRTVSTGRTRYRMNPLYRARIRDLTLDPEDEP